jgi:HlyD family secretion protein
MHRIAKYAMAGLFIAVVLFIWLNRTHGPERVESKEPSKPSSALAAFGRIEGREETIFLGASADGIVKQVLVTDGEKVSKGALLALIDCDDIRAEIEMAKAQAESARQARIRLLRGHRNEEREAAAQETRAANAVWKQTQEHLGRVDTLQQGEIAREAIEQAQRDVEVAQANREKAIADQGLINAAPLPEEVSRADAEVRAADQNVKVAGEKLAKCSVRAPISGTILKVMTKTGESYSTLLPHPLFTIADESIRRVRAEVDERDISKLKLGQMTTITANGFPGRQFDGQVVQVSQAMKPKSVLSDDPSQKVDRDVLEVTIDLNRNGEDLPLGLRVTARMNDAAMPIPAAPIDSSANPIRPQASPRAEATGPSTTAGATNLTGLVLQVGAMAHRENAEALTAALREKSFPAFVLAREGDPFYRVDVGPYPDLAGARIVEDQLKSGGFGSAIERQYPASKH